MEEFFKVSIELDINNEIGENESGDERRQMLFHFLKEYNAIIV